MIDRAHRKIYVASSWRNHHQPGVVESLRLAAHEVYDFKNPADGEHGFGWREIEPNFAEWTAEQFRRALAHPVARRGFKMDKAAMEWADTCVLVLPSGRSAHIEAGWFAGQPGRELFIYQPERCEPELMYLLADSPIALGIDELLEILDRPHCGVSSPP